MPAAARASDAHRCPKSEPGPVPHVGGPILAGEPTVLIGNQPAARQGDSASCCGPPDTIQRGEPTVLIGGAAAARVGDPMAHGGAIGGGCATVLIGSTILSKAAQDGTPFCEECERKRRLREERERRNSGEKSEESKGSEHEGTSTEGADEEA